MAGSGGGKCKKTGRNAARCLAYRNANRRDKNKILRMQKRLKNHPNDLVAVACLEASRKKVRGF